MKKTVALIIAAALAVSARIPAAAGENEIRIDTAGVAFAVTEEMENIRGQLSYDPWGNVGDGICLTAIEYLALTPDEYTSIMGKPEEERTDEDTVLFMTSAGTLLYLISIDGGRGIPEILEHYAGAGFEEEDLTEVGRADDVTFYTLIVPYEEEEFAGKMRPEFLDEYNALQDAVTGTLKEAEFFAPTDPNDVLIGQVLSFETEDLDGNPVSSEELFAEHEVTMINVWATWCGPCKAELPGLGEMSRGLSEKDAAIVGICLDADEKADTCREILTENNVEYTNLLPFDGIYDAMLIESIPASFFVGRDGQILEKPFIGAPEDVSAYEEIIDFLLE